MLDPADLSPTVKPSPASSFVGFRLLDEQAQELDHAVALSGLSRSEIMRRALESFMRTAEINGSKLRTQLESSVSTDL